MFDDDFDIDEAAFLLGLANELVEDEKERFRAQLEDESADLDDRMEWWEKD